MPMNIIKGVQRKRYLFKVRPTFFYFLIYGSADPNFWRNEIKIKEATFSFIFILSADLMNSLS